MPIFQHPFGLWSGDRGRDDEGSTPSRVSHERRWDLEDTDISGTSSTGDRTMDLGPFRLSTSDREELIRYIKRGETSSRMSDYSAGNSTNHSCTPHTSFQGLQMNESALHGREYTKQNPASGKEILASPADIQRPRSALHSGDFREGAAQLQTRQSQITFPGHAGGSHFGHFSSSPTTPWYTPPFISSLRAQRPPGQGPEQRSPTGTRSRAPSLGSCSSSYVLKAPTSPLVYQANNTDLDFSPRTDLYDLSTSSDKASRRRTLPPETFHGLNPSSPSTKSSIVNFGAPPRTLTSYTLQLASSVQTSPSRTRRPSLVSDVSLRPHAPMVGSYEESILRGRMSMNPSKPLDFTAQIGVLGKGKCKANLKCPPHVTVPFPAVFYSYPTSGSGRSISDDSPSPYVGLIDLENSLPKDDSDASRRRRRHRSPADIYNDPFRDSSTSKTKANDQETLRMREKRNRRADSPKRPPGGCYRIPQLGQLQIVIKNPNKTAVKLFLVPYDLSDMEPGTKTFIRQRSYSAGPAIDMPLTARKNLGTDRPEASLNATEDPKDKPVLRYLIHLNICCPSRGRFYLHSSIRVVFANRVPDGKERLRNEIQYPDPRYSTYKPARELSLPSTGNKAVDGSYWRRSTGPSLTGGLMTSTNESMRGSPYPHRPSTNTQDGVSAIPFQLSSASSVSTIDERFLSMNSGADRHGSNSLEWALIPSRRLPSESSDTHSTDVGMYTKLSKGDAGYGGYPFGSFSSGSEVGESLLAQRLRGLDVQKRDAHTSGADAN